MFNLGNKSSLSDFALAAKLVGMAGAQRHWSTLAYPAGTTNLTIQNQYPAVAPWTGFRLIYENGTLTATSITSSKVAISSTDGDTGANLTYTSVTFNGSTTAALPIITGAFDSTAVTTPVVSDHVSLPASASGQFVIARTYFSGSACAINPGAGELAAFNASTGLIYKTSFASGVIADSAACGTPTTGQIVCPSGIYYTYSVPAITVACTGGSILRGQATTANATGLVYKAASLLTNAYRVVSPYIGAISSQNSTVSSNNAKNIIDTIHPDILCILAGSGNDVDLSETGFNAMKGRVSNIINYCRIHNVVPIVLTLMPSSSLTQGQETLRLAQNIWALNLANQGVLVCDIAAVAENPANRATLLPAYDSGDGTHINDTCVAVVGALLATVISKIF
jgi:hypothetical protein